jgi:hypothetical protein
MQARPAGSHHRVMARSKARRWRSRFPWLAVAAIGLTVALAAGVSFVFGEGSLGYVSSARVELPIPAGGSHVERTLSAPRTPPDLTRVPAPIDPDLVESSPFGSLPIRGDDGRGPLVAYAHTFAFGDPRPRVAILVTGLGLQAELTEQAIALPGQISLAFSPYGSHVEADVDRARLAGHEAWLEVPMEPVDYPESDPGPHTLLVDASREENLGRLRWVLARALGYVGVAGEGGRFATDGNPQPIVQELAERGIGFIGLDDDGLEQVAALAGLPFTSARPAIDAEPSVLAIDYALARLENRALTTGYALGYAQLYPITVERLQAWIETLDDKGLVLAPASAIVREQAGLVPGVGG